LAVAERAAQAMRLGQMEITLYLAPLLQPVEAADQEALPLEMVALAAADR